MFVYCCLFLHSLFEPINQAKDFLCQYIDNYIRDRITLADEVIEDLAGKKIKDGDVILTYAKWVVFPLLSTINANFVARLQIVCRRKGFTGRSRSWKKVLCHCD